MQKIGGFKGEVYVVPRSVLPDRFAIALAKAIQQAYTSWGFFLRDPNPSSSSRLLIQLVNQPDTVLLLYVHPLRSVIGTSTRYPHTKGTLTKMHAGSGGIRMGMNVGVVSAGQDAIHQAVQEALALSSSQYILPLLLPSRISGLGSENASAPASPAYPYERINKVSIGSIDLTQNTQRGWIAYTSHGIVFFRTALSTYWRTHAHCTTFGSAMWGIRIMTIVHTQTSSRHEANFYTPRVGHPTTPNTESQNTYIGQVISGTGSGGAKINDTRFAIANYTGLPSTTPSLPARQSIRPVRNYWVERWINTYPLSPVPNPYTEVFSSVVKINKHDTDPTPAPNFDPIYDAAP